MASIRRHGALLSIAVVAACGGTVGRSASTPSPKSVAIATPNATVSAQPPAGLAANRLWLLYGGTNRSVDVVDVAALHRLTTMPDGAVTPDWTRMYAIGHDLSGPILEVFDPRSGAELDSVRAEIGMDLADGVGISGAAGGLSPSGRHLVLTGGPVDSNGRRTTSLFRVYDTAALHTPPHAVSLPGEFIFDGIDDAGRNLYLVQYTMQPDGSNTATLRRFDLVHDTLDPNPVGGATACSSNALLGAPVDRVFVAGGAWQLTAYIFGSAGPAAQALDLATGTATCVALPHPPASGASSESEIDMLWSLARSHDGRHVYAVNAGTGAVVDIAAAPPFHARNATLPTPAASPSPASWSPFGVTTAEAKRLLIGGAVLSSDDRLLYAAGDSGIDVIDTRTLSLRRVLLPDQPPQSLALSPDGRWLYVVLASTAGGLYQVDTTTGAAIRIPEYAYVSGVLRVDAAG
jgi:hypothetical protein